MAFRIPFSVWNTDANDYETGDAANLTVTLRVAGSSVTGLTPVEEGGGIYSVAPNTTQLPEGSVYALFGESSTEDVIVIASHGVRPEPMRGTDDAALASVWTSTVADRIDADISSRSSHTAAAVWDVATREITANADKTGYSLSDPQSFSTTGSVGSVDDPVTTDAASRTASKAEGFATPADLNDLATSASVSALAATLATMVQAGSVVTLSTTHPTEGQITKQFTVDTVNND